MKVGENEKAILTHEIDVLDKQIKNYARKLEDLKEKREAFELIRVVIWRHK